MRAPVHNWYPISPLVSSPQGWFIPPLPEAPEHRGHNLPLPRTPGNQKFLGLPPLFFWRTMGWGPPCTGALECLKVAYWGVGAESFPGSPLSWAGCGVTQTRILPWTPPPSGERGGMVFKFFSGPRHLHLPCALSPNQGGGDYVRWGINLSAPPHPIQHLFPCTGAPELVRYSLQRGINICVSLLLLAVTICIQAQG